jgi:hypothetical protein
MDDFDNNSMYDENYLFAFDYFCASAYADNSKFINEVLFDNKNSEVKRIRVFYIFKEVIKYFKDDKSLKSIEDTTNRFLELGSDNVEFNDLAVKTLLLINGKSYSKKIIEKYLIVDAEVGAELEEPKEENTDIKREFVDSNEPCPCGSEKKFKKCCMKEYIVAREEQNATDLTLKEIEKFKKFYKKILQFSYQYREKKKRIFADREIFKREAIDYFYENRNEIIMKFREQNTVSAEFSELLEGINRAFYGDSTVIAHTKKYALIAFGSNVSTPVLIQSIGQPFTHLLGESNYENLYIIKTAIIPYKDRYIFDNFANAGIVKGVFKNTLRWAVDLELEPKRKESKMVYIPINLNMMLFCNECDFKKVEKSFSKNLSEDFTKGLLKFFDTPLINKISLISSFISVEELLEYIEDNKEHDAEYLNIIDTVTTSFSKQSVISAQKFLELYRKRVPSRSSIGSSGLYTLQGVVVVEDDNQDDFIEFLKKFNKPKVRRELMVGFDNLVSETNKKEDLDIKLTFLGVTAYDVINLYEDFKDLFEFTQRFKLYDSLIFEYYSIYKDKMLMALIKDLFFYPFRKKS